MVRYNESLDPAILSSALIDLRVDATNVPVPVAVSLDATGRFLQIEPRELLLESTRYKLDLGEITDSDGDTNTLLYSSKFTTAYGAVEDDRQPMVLAMSPPDGSTDVGFNVTYSLRFDEPMNPLSLSTEQLTDILFSETNKLLRYQRGVLSAETEVTEMVPALVDLSGNAVVPVSSTFTTAASPDITRGRITSFLRGGARIGRVPTNPVLEWVASEPVDPASITRSGVYLYDNREQPGPFLRTIPITVNLSVDGRRIEMIPIEALAGGHSYAFYGSDLRDLSGNSFYENYDTFYATFEDDTTGPQFQDATVSDGQVEVPTNARFNVRFDGPLSLLATSAISLTDDTSTAQSIVISFDYDRAIVTVTPNQLLDANRSYTLTVNDLVDISGNVQVDGYTATFTTALGADLQQGSIANWSYTSDATLAQDVVLSVVLDERVDPTFVNASVFFLRDEQTLVNVPGAIGLSTDGTEISFIPDINLDANGEYRLYVRYFADLAGNYMIISNSRRFFTGN